MEFNYEKLTHDLREAKESALKSVIGDDEGMADLDCIALSLPGLREEKVIKAAREAGLHASRRIEWIGERYCIDAPHGSYGNDHTRQIEAMYECLKGKEYDVMIPYRLD